MQKIAFVRALLADDIRTLMNQLCNGLDYPDLVFNLLREKNMTIINSTHDPEQFKNIDLHINIDIVR